MGLPSPPPATRRRVESIDLLRGVIMIVMALDHTRDYFGVPGQSPTDLATASAALFLTRWVTHFCAPVFFLLTGTGSFLALARRTPAELSRFLVTRGLWLLFLEVVVMRCFVYQFNVDYRVTMLIVLWALGWAMITLALFVRLPPWVAGVFGAILVLGHNLLDGVTATGPLFAILHGPGFVLNTPRVVIFATYPLVPWIGVTALGYSLGAVYRLPPPRRRAILTGLGVALTLAFVVVRAINRYGDPTPWTHQPRALFTLLSFLDVTKYPPSLSFLTMTLGPALLFLAAVDGGTPRLLGPALTFGKVPLFYYVVHFFLIHALAVAVCALRFGSVRPMLASPDLAHYPFSPPPGWGFSLPLVYGVYVAVVVAVYPLCRWFAALKARRNDAWLSYL